MYRLRQKHKLPSLHADVHAVSLFGLPLGVAVHVDYYGVFGIYSGLTRCYDLRESTGTAHELLCLFVPRVSLWVLLFSFPLALSRSFSLFSRALAFGKLLSRVKTMVMLDVMCT